MKDLLKLLSLVLLEFNNINYLLVVNYLNVR
jgi:hypothetical protein